MSFWKNRNKPEETDLSASGIRTRQSDSVGGESREKKLSTPNTSQGSVGEDVAAQSGYRGLKGGWIGTEKSSTPNTSQSSAGEDVAAQSGYRGLKGGWIGTEKSSTPNTSQSSAGGSNSDKTVQLSTIAEFSPWVKMGATEAYKQYKDLTPAQYLRDLTAYKKAGGEEVGYADIVGALDGRNPNKSENDIKKENRRYKAATAVNALGTVLANLLNVYRTQKGNPSMRIDGMEKGQQRIDQLRARGEQLDRAKYQDYLNVLMQQRKERAAQVAAALKHKQNIELEAAKQNSPLNKEKINTEKARQGNIFANTNYTNSRKAGQDIINQNLSKKHEDEHKLSEARRRQALAAAAKSGRDDDGKKDSIDVVDATGNMQTYSKKKHGDNYILQAYYWILNNTGGEASKYKVSLNNQMGIFGSGRNVPNVAEMQDVITKYNYDMMTKKNEETSKNEKKHTTAVASALGDGTRTYTPSETNWSQYEIK